MLSTRQFAARHAEFAARGVALVRLFHSPPEALQELVRGERAVPFTIVADPERVAYRAFGVGGSLFALLRPGALARIREARTHGLTPRWRDALRDGIGGCPADFLIGADGRLRAVRYGRHFADSLAPAAALGWIDALRDGRPLPVEAEAPAPAGRWPRTMALLCAAAFALLLLLSPSTRAFLAEGGALLWRHKLDFPAAVAALREFLAPFAGRAWLVTSALMILQSLAAPIPAVPLTLVNALLYGPWLGALISWGSAQFAAALCFTLGRALGRPAVTRLFRPAVVARLDHFFERDGLLAVMVLRLIPYVSFDLVSWVGGLTSMRLLPFLAATGLGQAPATLVYSFAGASIVTEPAHAARIALLFLGGMALLAGGFALWRRRRPPPA
ncbi:MAG: redoxin domain-containing protein [Planctomycetes bacterium]|nr:redoxin domain-containing protein [Planctomycetota bacterium]